MNITSGRVPSAQKIVIYGVEKVGKTTLASMFPGAVFIDVEGSTKHMDVRRMDTPQSWTMLMEQVGWISLHPDSCQTLIIDTADWAEQLCIAHICASHQWDGIEQKDYGKGYVYLAEEFGNLLNRLSDVVERGVHVVLTAHAQVKQFKQPDEATPYDRWELKLQKKTASLVKEWSDMILFANYKTFAVTDSKTKKTTAQGGKRVLYTSHLPAWDAGNRHGLPAELDIEGIKALPPELAAAIAFTPAAPARQSIADTTDFQATTVLPNDVAVTASAAVGALAAEDLEPIPVAELPHLKKLIQLMEDNDVNESDIRAAVAAKGVYPAATPIDKYDVAYVEGVLIAAWPQVLAAINTSKQQSLDAVPFK